MPPKSRKLKRPHYVLIIEDNAHHAELITEVLDRHFAPVIIHTVDSIEDGLDFASQAVYDLILTAGIVGKLPITNYIPRLSDAASNTPIIVISGQGDEKFAAELIKQGAAEYLSKNRETLDGLAVHIYKQLSQKRRNKQRIKKKIDKSDKIETSTTSEIIREVDRLTQQALALAGPKRRKRTRAAIETEQLDKLLSQIKKLRELTMKLLT
ncbi:MAG: response regulator [Deltaproteobacteria bacterium]|jgi:DNA-binding NtrC family response regulator|nr:response regulator [Deltaproteobacteria bacterium]